jgi:hypothetical protein
VECLDVLIGGALSDMQVAYLNLEVTFQGESWSNQAVKIVTVRSSDVAARGPFVFPIVQS